MLPTPTRNPVAEIDVARRKASGKSKERLLIEFPSALLARADRAAEKLAKNRSELIRSAVEGMLDEFEKRELDEQLALAYAANGRINLELLEEFKGADREGW
jgi:metal-responsive CopG/Arc/MetJ family transcriptional regulator